MANLKRCTRCGEEKPATTEFFRPNKLGRDGLRSQCRPCQAESSHQWYVENRKRVEEERRVRRQNPESRAQEKAKEAEWNLKNKEHVLERQRKWREANRERISEQNRRWARDNKDAVNSKTRRRRARKGAISGDHTAADIQAQYERQRGKCYWCGVKVGKEYHVDHILPLARGGSNDPENLVIACPTCNKSRGAKLPSEWPQGNRLI